ncbi:hypothetical protein DFH09DRAFT_803811, partial [Mycena vulgaris]
MPLPKDVPTLCAKGTKNLTRPDNVFCSKDFLKFFISCDAYPHRTPGTTDHFPVISVIDMVPPAKVTGKRRNWRAGDWEGMREMLEDELKGEPEVRGYASVEDVLGGIARLDVVVLRCVDKHIPLSKLSPHSKRWWKKEYGVMKKGKEKLAR